MSHAPIIKTTALSYHYPGAVKTLSGINLKVERGDIYGFLGPNGSGKTTTLSLLLGLLPVQEGSIEIFGQSLQAHRRDILQKIGSLVEAPSLYGHLTAKENLEVYRPVYKASRERIGEVLSLVGLEDTGSKVVKKFSLGMKQRLAIALALLPRPQLLILDEPTNGLDPSGIIELRELVRKLNREEGITFLVSSHILSEVEKMVSRIGIIFGGQLIFQGTLAELHRFQQAGAKLQVQTSNNEAAIKILHHYEPEVVDDMLSLSFQDIGQVAAINRMLIHNDLDVYLLKPRERNLEQLFIDLTTAQS
jgi:lantibiotic transport system ATP-binding protein